MAKLLLTAGVTGLALNSARMLLGFTGLRAAMLAVTAPLTGFVAVIARLLALPGFIALTGYQIGAGVSDIVTGERKSWIGRQARKVATWIDPDVAMLNGPKGGGEGGSAMDFWMGQGYTREQAAGIVANELAESGGNPNARGDGGLAHGLYQHHQDRRAAIKAATGIDMSTASAMDQRRGAAWEMKNGNVGFNDAYFRGLNNPADAAAYMVTNFERPKDQYGESVKRARAAMDIARSSPFGSGSGGTTNNSGQTISVGTVTVQTNASDPQAVARAVKEELGNIHRETHAQYSDGVGY